MSAAAASRAAGGSKDLIRGLYRNPGQRPQGRMLSGLAVALQVTEAWLLHGDEAPLHPPPSTGTSDGQQHASPANQAPHAASMPLDVPVYGTAAGSALGIKRDALKVTREAVDFVRRPPGLAAARNAYALYVENDSMAPRYPPGELILIHPGRPVRPGDIVVVHVQTAEHTPIETFIKILVSRTDEDLVCRQYNPDAEICFRTNTVRSVHRVLSMAEAFGV